MILNDELMKTGKRQSSYKYTFIKVKMESGQSIKKNSKKYGKHFKHCANLRGVSKILCLNLKKSGYFLLFIIIGLRSMDISLGRKGT